MNFKINLWTLLFVLTAGAWAFTHNVDKPGTSGQPDAETTTLTGRNPGKVDTPSINILARYEIPQKRYFSARKAYQTVLNCFLQNGCTDGTLATYYRLEWDELIELMGTKGNVEHKNLYIIPIREKIKDPSKGPLCIDAVTLAFTTDKPTEKTDSSYVTSAKIYNFATPCPPLCDEKQFAVDLICDPYN